MLCNMYFRKLQIVWAYIIFILISYSDKATALLFIKEIFPFSYLSASFQKSSSPLYFTGGVVDIDIILDNDIAICRLGM